MSVPNAKESKVTFFLEGGGGSTSTSTNTSSIIYLPESEDVPGLEQLELTNRVFILQDNVDDLPYTIGTKIRSCYKIFNADGKHIYTAAQADLPFKQRKFLMYIFSADPIHRGEPILKIMQRCPNRNETVDLLEIQPFLERDRLIDRLLPRPRRSKLCNGYHEIKSFAHVLHLDKGMLGSITWDTKNYQIYSSDMRNIVTVPLKLPRTPEEPPPAPMRNRISCCDVNWNYYDYYVSVNTDNVLPEVPLGRISFGLENPPNLPSVYGPGGERAGKKEGDFGETGCCFADFPVGFSPTEKCLVLGLALDLVSV